MKIRQLKLLAYGPFTDRVVAFDHAGLQIVYGPNEAGKSSALRGLKALLYGIPVRTADNFIHNNDRLRIQGHLQSADGHEQVFVRRKGNKNTLLTEQGEALEEQLLQPYLQGISQAFFDTLFGIDHQALIQGGQEILEQKGEVGQLLFSAALGSQSLHQVLAELDQDASELFKPQGSKQRINAAITTFNALKTDIRSHSLSSREWQEQHQSLQQTKQEVKHIQQQLLEKRSSLNHLQRIQRVLPKLARRNESLKDLNALGKIVILSEDFAAQRQATMHALETNQAIVQKEQPRLDSCKQTLADLSINLQLLEQAEAIENLHQRLGEYQKAEQDRPRLETEHQQLRADARAILREIRPDLEPEQIEKLRPLLQQRKQLSESGQQLAVLKSRLSKLDSDLQEDETRLQSLRQERQELPPLVASQALNSSIKVARKQGDLDGQIQNAEAEYTTLQAECQTGVERLNLWQGDLGSLYRLHLPERESLRRFDDEYAELRQQRKRLNDNRQQTETAVEIARRGLDEIQRAVSVPSEPELQQARSQRDQLWQVLRQQWVDGETSSQIITGNKAEQADAFEQYIASADELSDRLRREADRVQKLASLQADEKTGLQQLAGINNEMQSVSDRQQKLEADWQALWSASAIAPHSPREMLGWLDHVEKLREQIVRLNRLSQSLQSWKENRQKLIEQLQQQLQDLQLPAATSDQIERVLSECEAYAKQLDENQRRCESLDRQIKEKSNTIDLLNGKHQQAKNNLHVWQTQWAGLMQKFGLPEETLPASADDFLSKLRLLFNKMDAIDERTRRIEAMQQDAENFRQQVNSMTQVLAPEFSELVIEESVVRLNRLLADNRTARSTQQQIQSQAEQAEQEIQTATTLIQTLTARIDALCKEASCDQHRDLEAAEQASARYLDIQQIIETIEQDILEQGEGADLAALESQAENEDADTLSARIDPLNNDIDALEQELNLLNETLGRKKEALEQMDGNDETAALANQAQSILATMQSDVERYVQVKLAAKILRDQIERYRQENQGPLVKRASEFFAQLTRASFIGLKTDFNDKDEPILVGIRPDETQVKVQGMSSGTRDQLYLALRLASLEKYMESHEPMPFIVDDILVDFDDARSEAALKALATLAEKTQVILFTHHSQVVEQARQLQGQANVLYLDNG